MAKNKKSVESKEWEQFLEETQGAERDYMGEVLKSRRIWRWVALGASILAGVIMVIHMMNPVTKTEPFLLSVDNSTGYVAPLSRLKVEEKTYGETVDSYFLGQYVRSYESYNYHNIQKDYDATILMSSQDVGVQYQNIYKDTPRGGKARDALLGQAGVREVKIISIVPDTENGTARVRFLVTTKNGSSIRSENFIASITYEYVSQNIDSEVRQINPLGFVVTSYRADKENV